MGNIKIRYLPEASSTDVYSGNLLAVALDTDGGYAEVTKSFNFNQIVLGGSGALGGPGSPFVFNDTSTEQVFQGGISAPGISLMGNLDITGRISGLVDGYFNNLYITGSDSQWYQVTTGWSGDGGGGGGSSPWTELPGHIFYNNPGAGLGHVGIGNFSSPVPYGLTVKGKDGIVVSEDTAVSALGTQFLIIGGAESAAGSSADYGVSIRQVKETASNGYGMAFWGRKDASSSYAERMRLSHSGHLGIGEATPQAKLHVTGGKILAPSGDFTESLTISGVSVATGEGGGGASSPWTSSAGDIYYDGGDVGIGTSTPTERLHVTGGKILAPSGDFSKSLTISGVSVATGEGGGGASSPWTSSAGDIYYDGGDVGIGTSTPTERLHVTGGKILAPSGDFSKSLTISGVSVATGEGGGGASSPWTSSAGDIYYDGGDVGIGTSTPTERLHVTGGKILAPSGDFSKSLTISGVSVATGEGGGGASSPWTSSAGYIFYNDSPGTVGIGAWSSPPPYGLTVKEKGGIAVTENTTAAPDGTQFLMIQGGATPAPSFGSSIKLVKEGPNANDFGMSFWTMDQFLNVSSQTEKMRLSSEGYLGMSTPDPKSALTVSGDTEICGRLSVSTDSPSTVTKNLPTFNGIEGGQIILNLPNNEEGDGKYHLLNTGTFAIGAFEDTTDDYGFGTNSGLFRMFHGGGFANPVHPILTASSGGAVVLGGGVPHEFAKLTVGNRWWGSEFTEPWLKSQGPRRVFQSGEDGIAIYNALKDDDPGFGATLALLSSNVSAPANGSRAAISANASGLHIRNHNGPGGNEGIVFDLVYNSESLNYAPVLQLTNTFYHDNVVILDYDNLPSSITNTVRGQIYRDGDFLKISAG